MKKILLVLLATVLLFGLCSCKNNNGDSTDINNETNNDAVIQNTMEDADTSFFKSDADTFETSTPFASLHYPVEYKDKVRVDVTDEGGNCHATFIALLDSKEFPLFAFVFGEQEEGNLLGELHTEDGIINVYCEDYTSGATAMLSAESADIYLQMSEDINVVISNLVYSNDLVIA